MHSLGLMTLALTLASVSILAPSASAQSQEVITPENAETQGRRLFTDGRLAFEEGRYADALQYFRAAYELTGHNELLYNVGLSAERTGRRDEARQAFETYLAEDPEADNVAEVRARLAILTNADGTGAGAGEAAEEGSGFPWLWVGIGAGVLVAAAAVVTIVLVASGGDTVQEPLAGDLGPGGVVFALDGGIR